MAKPKLLDLFCKAGGCTRGYQQAGFEVTGVDIERQPNYIGDYFIRADAITYLTKADLSKYDAIHASPPCQLFSHRTPTWAKDQHQNLITPVQALLREIGKPYIIENVPGARRMLRRPFMLCGSMFGIGVLRHRFFETNWPIRIEKQCDHKLPYRVFRSGGSYGKSDNETDYANQMRVSWMTTREARQAIPPVYTRLIGRRLIRHLRLNKSVPRQH